MSACTTATNSTPSSMNCANTRVCLSSSTTRSVRPRNAAGASAELFRRRPCAHLSTRVSAKAAAIASSNRVAPLSARSRRRLGASAKSTSRPAMPTSPVSRDSARASSPSRAVSSGGRPWQPPSSKCPSPPHLHPHSPARATLSSTGSAALASLRLAPCSGWRRTCGYGASVSITPGLRARAEPFQAMFAFSPARRRPRLAHRGLRRDTHARLRYRHGG